MSNPCLPEPYQKLGGETLTKVSLKYPAGQSFKISTLPPVKRGSQDATVGGGDKHLEEFSRLRYYLLSTHKTTESMLRIWQVFAVFVGEGPGWHKAVVPGTQEAGKQEA